ncbi:MAG: SH3 domain-containing protein [Saprospiraceae bacterium]
MRTNFMLSLVFIFLSISLMAQQKAVVRGTDVNVRNCAGLDCDIEFQVNTGEQCNVISAVGEQEIDGYGINKWYKVDFNGHEGTIYGAFLDFPQKNTITSPIINTTIGTITGVDVNVRDGADLFNTTRLFKLNTGDQVDVIGKTSNYFICGLGSYPWYQIRYNNQKGYVFGAFIQTKNSTSTVSNTSPTTNTNTSKVGTIIGDKVNVRSSTDLNSSVVFQLNIGAKCTIKKELPAVSIGNLGKYPWYEIEYNGQTGYLFGKFISVPSKTTHKSKIWALVVGVSDYSGRMNNYGARDLRYCNEDAKEIYQFFKSPNGGNLPDHQIKLLRDSEATRQNILANAKTLFSKADSDDLIILYFSGHGGPNILMAHDNPLKHSDLKNVIDNSKASKKICIADACYSGTWSKSASAQLTQKSMTKDQLERLYYDALSTSGNGLALFMSSQRHETSLEDSSLKQGLFTYYIIEGLKGKANKDVNKIITIDELYLYVKANVSNRAMMYFSHNQNPILTGHYDKNMPVGVID